MNIPLGNSKEDYKVREEIISLVYHRWIEENPNNEISFDWYWLGKNDCRNQKNRRKNTVLHNCYQNIKKKKSTGWLSRKVIAKFWTSILDCSPIDFDCKDTKKLLICKKFF